MPSVVATAGSASANSYITVAEGDTFADERLQVANWTGAEAEDKARAVIGATQILDQRTYQGWKSSTTQALKWPRTDTFDEDGEEYATNAIPAFLKRATFEVALWLLNQNAESTDPLAPTGLEGFIRARVGPLSVEPNHGHRAGALPDSVTRAIAHVLHGGGGRITVAQLERS